MVAAQFNSRSTAPMRGARLRGSKAAPVADTPTIFATGAALAVTAAAATIWAVAANG